MSSSVKEGVCHVVGAGSFWKQAFQPRPGDYVIAADAGYRHLEKVGYRPNLVLGDFDSLGKAPDHPHVLRLPVEKDDTDTLHAVKVGMELGYRRFLLHGALGGPRLDHTLANLQTLVYLTCQGCKGWILGPEDTVVTALHNGRLTFPAERRGILSVFCMGDRAEGVTLTGLKYPLENAVLTCDVPLGVSNEFTGVPASIEVKKGNLLILWHDPEFQI